MKRYSRLAEPLNRLRGTVQIMQAAAIVSDSSTRLQAAMGWLRQLDVDGDVINCVRAAAVANADEIEAE